MILNKHLEPTHAVQCPVILNGARFATFILYGFVLNTRIEITIENMASFSARLPCLGCSILAALLRLRQKALKRRQYAFCKLRANRR